MNKNMNILKKVSKGLLSGNVVKHERPKKPTKADLNRKFTIRFDKKGNRVMKEINA